MKLLNWLKPKHIHNFNTKPYKPKYSNVTRKQCIDFKNCLSVIEIPPGKDYIYTDCEIFESNHVYVNYKLVNTLNFDTNKIPPPGINKNLHSVCMYCGKSKTTEWWEG